MVLNIKCIDCKVILNGSFVIRKKGLASQMVVDGSDTFYLSALFKICALLLKNKNSCCVIASISKVENVNFD